LDDTTAAELNVVIGSLVKAARKIEGLEDLPAPQGIEVD
jgi:hypothetical protein